MRAILHFMFIGLWAWLFVSLLWLPLFVAGVPFVAVAAWKRRWHLGSSTRYKSRENPDRPRSITKWNWRWLDALWGNSEDGVTGDSRWWPTYAEAKGWKDVRMQAFMWSAIRNPVNGFRFLTIVDYAFDPSKIRYVGNSDTHQDLEAARRQGRSRGVFWFYAWHGMYPAFWLIRIRDEATHTRIRFGWKHTPAFRRGIPEGDYRLASESFTPMQLGLKRSG